MPSVAEKNQLFYGDNLEVLQTHIRDESVDLVYLDPPFNSNRNYSVIFSRDGRTDADNTAQIEAFEDTWHWTQATDQQYADFMEHAPGNAADALSAFRTLLGENDASAYLVNMAPRLLELHRVLKETGSLFLHCDPTMSHYLKVLLDAIFGAQNFRNEIVWKRAHTVKGNAGQGAKHFGRSTDSILFYTKTDEYKFHQAYAEYDEAYLKRFKFQEADGRRYRTVSMAGPGGAAKGNPYYEVLGVSRYWRYSKEKMAGLIADGQVVQSRPGAVPERKQYLDDGKGVAVQSLWTDIISINPMAAERLGYPTQKPLALLRRIIETASSEGDVVLDPFCGCGTTVDAAQALGRRWVGIDITYIAVDLIMKRLEHTYGTDVIDMIEINGIPSDFASAQALFRRSPFDFERWAVSQVGAEPNQRQVGDRGIDGVARFPLDAQRKKLGKVLVSVKGGKNVPPTFVRDLLGTVQQTDGAAMGVLITMDELTKGSHEVIDRSGSYTFPVNGQAYPVLQHLSVRDILGGKRPNMPGTLLPYIQAKQSKVVRGSETLFD